MKAPNAPARSRRGVFLFLEYRGIAGDKPVKRTQALEVLSGIVDRLMHSRRLTLQRRHCALDLLGSDRPEVFGEGPGWVEGIGYGCATRTPCVASAWLE